MDGNLCFLCIFKSLIVMLLYCFIFYGSFFCYYYIYYMIIGKNSIIYIMNFKKKVMLYFVMI